MDKHFTELQRICFAGDSGLASRESFFRCPSDSVSIDESGMNFSSGMNFDSFTFYNAFSIEKWRDMTDLSDLVLSLKGTGRIVLQLNHAHLDGVGANSRGKKPSLESQGVVTDLLLQTEITLDPENQTHITIPQYRELCSGLVYFNIFPLEDGLLTRGAYLTSTPIRNRVKLGLVITHFNRQSAVQSSIARLREHLLGDEQFNGRVKIILVDNSRNSNVPAGECVEIIENPNYGGSGGFSRGLLSLVESGDFTHALFMDDDASCETESIRRAFRLLSFAKRSDLAVAGTLLRKNAPHRIYEKGAVFDGLCRALYRDLDIREPKTLIGSENSRIKPNYGGWWFFAFNISAVRRFPFPFFVRGDDTSFSIANQFDVVTMNGIASYGDSFEAKRGALTTYLDTRSHLVQQMTLTRISFFRIVGLLCRFFAKSLLSYEYDSARAIILAISDVSQGPNFFLDNMDMSRRMPLLKQLASLKTPCHEQPDTIGVEHAQNQRENIFRLLFRIITINGYLLPNFVLKQSVLFRQPSFQPEYQEIFPYRKIYYADPDQEGDNYIVEMDRLEMLFSSCKFTVSMVDFVLRYARNRKLFRSQLPDIMSKQFWLQQYGKSGA